MVFNNHTDGFGTHHEPEHHVHTELRCVNDFINLNLIEIQFTVHNELPQPWDEWDLSPFLPGLIQLVSLFVKIEKSPSSKYREEKRGAIKNILIMRSQYKTVLHAGYYYNGAVTTPLFNEKRCCGC